MRQAFILIETPGQSVYVDANVGVFSILLMTDCTVLLRLETEESKGGEGGDPGECGPVPEDRDRDGEGSPGREEGPVPGAESDLRPPAQLQRRDAVVSAEGQPLHHQQQPGARGHRRGRGPDAPFLPGTHPQGSDPLSHR